MCQLLCKLNSSCSLPSMRMSTILIVMTTTIVLCIFHCNMDHLDINPSQNVFLRGCGTWQLNHIQNPIIEESIHTTVLKQIGNNHVLFSSIIIIIIGSSKLNTSFQYILIGLLMVKWYIFINVKNVVGALLISTYKL